MKAETIGPGMVSMSPLQATLRKLEPQDWSAKLAEFADGNFYQTYAYGSVSWGENQLAHLIVREGEVARAIAQVRMARIGRLWGVAYVRWGPCVFRRGEGWDGRAFGKALEVLRDEFVGRRGWVLRVLPNLFREAADAEPARRVLEALGFREQTASRSYRTIRLDLALSLDDLRQRLDGKWRNQLNAARRNRLQVIEGTESSLFDRFAALYDEMMTRKRFVTSVNVRQFARIQERLPEAEKMRVALALCDGQTHAGLVATGIGDTGIYLLGATGDAGLQSKASYLLQWRMIEYLKSAGCRFYDLGGINPEANPGVYHFKAGLGGEEVSQLGCFELAPSEVRRKVLHLAEAVRMWWTRFRKG